jgi:hypothetical protein
MTMKFNDAAITQNSNAALPQHDLKAVVSALTQTRLSDGVKDAIVAELANGASAAEIMRLFPDALKEMRSKAA